MIIPSVAQVIGDRPLPATRPHVTVRDACHVLDEFNVGALVVLEGDRLVGVVSERDVIRKCICGGRLTSDTTVAEIMTPDPVTINPAETLAAALGQMIAGNFRHLPVVYEGRTLGLLSIRDIPTEYRLMAERFNEYQGTADVA